MTSAADTIIAEVGKVIKGKKADSGKTSRKNSL